MRGRSLEAFSKSRCSALGPVMPAGLTDAKPRSASCRLWEFRPVT